MAKNLTMVRQGGNPNRQHQHILQELNKIKQNCNLIDIWQTQNNSKTKFTYENDILNFKNLSSSHDKSVIERYNERQKRSFVLEVKHQCFRKQTTNKKLKIFGYIGKIKKTFILTKLSGGTCPSNIYKV